MKKLNKLFLAAGSMAAVATPIAAVVSCGTNENDLHPEVVLVTDGGSVQDHSFNEQAADALKAIKGVGKLTPSMYVQPSAGDIGAITSKYQSMAARGAKIVLAPGFAHIAAIDSFIKTHTDDALKFILVDGEVASPNVASIKFDVMQPSFQAGYMAGKYLMEKDPSINHKVGTFGGGPFASVTDFMAGFVAGVKYFNTLWATDTNNTNKTKVSFVQFPNEKQYTESGFVPGNGESYAQTLLNGGAEVILPVSSTQTADVLREIDQIGNKGVKVIGVDVDQTLTLPSYTGYFLTSVQKEISTAFQNVYRVAMGEKLDPSIHGFGQVTTMGTLANKLVQLAAPKLSGEEQTRATEAKNVAEQISLTDVSTAVANYTWAQALNDIKTM